MSRFTLYGRKGWGSMIVEAALAQARLPVDLVEVEEKDHRLAHPGLLAANPLGQIPTLVLPDGRAMSESAAIILYLSELAPDSGLAPPPGDPTRPEFLRWLVFLVAQIYPTFTYGDYPARFVPEAQAETLRAGIYAYREKLWRQVEDAAQAPWFLGDRFSALDIYVAIMTTWRPRRPWFKANTPKLVAIAEAAARLPKLAPVFTRNWG